MWMLLAIAALPMGWSLMLILSSLLYPVLFILVLMVLGIIIQAGGFWAEWLERSRLAKHLPEVLLRYIREGRPKGVWPPGHAFYRPYYRINCGLFTAYHLADLLDENAEMTIMKQNQDGEMELITKGKKTKGQVFILDCVLRMKTRPLTFEPLTFRWRLSLHKKRQTCLVH
jgi:hypothetical protein